MISKKIGIDAREYSTSSGRYVERLLWHLQDLDSEGYEFYIFLKNKDFDKFEPRRPNIKKVLADYKEFTFRDEQVNFLKLLNKMNLDLMHFTFPQQPIAYRRKTITTILDLTTLRFVNPSKNKAVFKVKQKVYEYVMRRAIEKSVHLFAISQFVIDDASKYFKTDISKFTLLYNAAELTTTLLAVYKPAENKKFLLYTGRPLPHKNLERTIKAFGEAQTKDKDLYFFIVGKKDELMSQHQQFTLKNKINNVIFTGFISDEQLLWMYKNCVSYVCPSLSEGFGLPGLEAMAAGAPVVSSNATCLPEVYGDAPIYFNPLKTTGITNAMNIVSGLTKDEREKMIRAGIKQSSKFSWARSAAIMLETYRKNLNK